MNSPASTGTPSAAPSFADAFEAPAAPGTYEALPGHPDPDPGVSPLFAAFLDAAWPLKQQTFPDRVTTDEDAVAIALAVSMRADCTRRRVGAVIIDRHGRVAGTGRNGAPSGYPGCLSAGACPRGQMSKEQVKPGSSYRGTDIKCTAIHAEANALLYTTPDARRGGFIAVTDGPCDDCSLALAGSGLARAIWPEQNSEGGWVIRERLIGSGAPIGGLYG